MMHVTSTSDESFEQSDQHHSARLASQQQIPSVMWSRALMPSLGRYGLSTWALVCLQPVSGQTILPEISETDLVNRIIDVELPVGVVQGSAAVSATGAALYSIPIYTPPGTNGVQPGLSITYSSQGRDGVLGWGWSLGGVSSIVRTGLDWYHDGMTPGVQGVTYSGFDRFVADGQRLVLTSAGAYGADGTIYDTESATFSAYQAIGQIGHGPASFTVITRSGMRMEYGGTTDSRIMGEGGSSVYAWRLNKVVDPNGNYITYFYTPDEEESRLASINYTGNVAAGITPYNRIDLVYTARPDGNEVYIDGTDGQRTTHLLQEIRVFCDGSMMKSYAFNYSVRDIGKSYLREVTEFAGDGMEHLNTTVFKL